MPLSKYAILPHKKSVDNALFFVVTLQTQTVNTFLSEKCHRAYFGMRLCVNCLLFFVKLAFETVTLYLHMSVCRKNKKQIVRGEIYISSTVTVIGKLKDLDTGLRYVKLSVTDGKDYTEAIVSRKQLYSDKGVLLSYGANVTTFSHACKTLYEQENKLQTECIYHNIGWSVQEGKRVFKAHRLYSSAELTAEYQGALSIQPTGSFEAWQSGIKQFAMPQVPLQIAIATGVSALFEGMLADELDSSLILHLKGDSSKGKTTFAMLALSVACSPQSIEGNTLYYCLKKQ